jgi:hypothetical protein
LADIPPPGGVVSIIYKYPWPAHHSQLLVSKSSGVEGNVCVKGNRAVQPFNHKNTGNLNNKKKENVNTDLIGQKDLEKGTMK